MYAVPFITTTRMFLSHNSIKPFKLRSYKFLFIWVIPVAVYCIRSSEFPRWHSRIDGISAVPGCRFDSQPASGIATAAA